MHSNTKLQKLSASVSEKTSPKVPKKVLMLLFMGIFCVGCGPTQTQEAMKSNAQSLARLDNRVSSIEGRMLALDLEVKASQDRVYEVRNRSGRKTGMTAHVMAVQPTQMATAPVRQAPRPARPATAPRQSQVASSPKLQPKPMTASVAPMPQAASSVPATTPSASASSSPKTAPLAQVNTPNPNISTGYNLALPPETAVLTPTAQSDTQVSVPGSPVTPASTGIAAPVAPQMPPSMAPGAPNSLGVAQATPPAPVKFSPTVPGEKNAYDRALRLVRSGQSQAGRDEFQAFLNQYPSSKLVPNAHYWIGESYYSQGNFNNALASFKQVSTNFPRHHKTSDALLKAAMTYQKLGDTENAKAHYQSVIKSFPRSSAARIARNKKL